MLLSIFIKVVSLLFSLRVIFITVHPLFFSRSDYIHTCKLDYFFTDFDKYCGFKYEIQLLQDYQIVLLITTIIMITYITYLIINGNIRLKAVLLTV